MSPSHPRTVAAIAGIIACALAAIIVTAIILIPARGDDAAPTATTRESTLPKLKPMLLSLDEASKLVGVTMKMTIEGNSLGQPAGPDYAVSPAACTSVAFFAQAVTYRNVAWELARSTQYSAPPILVSQSVVQTASPEVASSFLTEQRVAWQKCLGMTYRFGTYSAIDFHVTDVNTPRSDRIVAKTRQGDAGPPNCEHVMAVKDAYVVEAVTCGYPPYDTNALTDEILARIPG